jgi:hypothetical protein
VKRRSFLSSLFGGAAALIGARAIKAEAPVEAVAEPAPEPVSVMTVFDQVEDPVMPMTQIIEIEAGEWINIGDLVRVGSDGLVYGAGESDRIIGAAMEQGTARRTVKIIVPQWR